MTDHEHVPRRIISMATDNHLGECPCGQVIVISHYMETIHAKSLFLEWEPEGDWRDPTGKERDQLYISR